MSNDHLTAIQWAMIWSFALLVLAMFTVLALGLHAIWHDEWHGERRRADSWCPYLAQRIEQVRAKHKISKFYRDLELHRRVSRGGTAPGRHHLAHA